jgi:large subunit ribosomal protein L30
MAEETLQITLSRSLHGMKPAQRATVRSLGLRRRHQTVQQPDRPEIRGMVARVAHLVDVRYVGRDEAVDIEPGQEPKGEGRPAAGQSVADEEVTELREAEDEALAAAEESRGSTAGDGESGEAQPTGEGA